MRLRGWGRVANANRAAGGCRIELRDVGELAVMRRSPLGVKELLRASIEDLELTVGRRQVTTGGGWFGGGRGFLGAAVGRFEAQVLNAMTTKNWEQTQLGVFVELTNGTKRDAVFEVHDLDESELRDRLAEAIPPWADGYVEAGRTRLLLEPIHSREELYDHYDRIDRVENNRLLDSGQALALRSEARTPILTAILAELDAGEWTPQQLENTREEIEDLYQRRRITRDQAGHLESRFAAAAGDTPLTPPQRARRLDVLAELRGSGALSEEEFQIERERTLKQPAAPS